MLDWKSCKMPNRDSSIVPSIGKTKKTEVDEEIIVAQQNLTILCDKLEMISDNENSNSSMRTLIRDIGFAFQDLVEKMLTIQIDQCIRNLKGEEVEATLLCLASLAQNGEHLGR